MTTVMSRRFLYISIATVYTVLSALGTVLLLRDYKQQKKAVGELESRVRAQQQEINNLNQAQTTNSKRFDWLNDETRFRALSLEEGIRLINDTLEEDKERNERRFKTLSQRLDGTYAALEQQLASLKQDDKNQDKRNSIALSLLRMHYLKLAMALKDSDVRLSQLADANQDLIARVQELKRNPLLLHRDLNEMYESMILPTVQVSHTNEVGAGTIVYSKGGHSYVLTAAHVLSREDNNAIKINTYDRDGIISGIYDAEIVAFNEQNDLALLKIDSNETFETARLGSESRNVKVFDRVCAVGCPLGYSPMPTLGEITTKSKLLNGEKYWMINAPTIFGNSGGGIYLADTQEFLGVLSRVSAYNNFINIAVPHMGILVRPDDIRAWLDEENLPFVYNPELSRDVCLERREQKSRRLRLANDTQPFPKGAIEPAGAR